MQNKINCLCKNIAPPNQEIMKCCSCNKLSHTYCYQAYTKHAKNNFYCFFCRIHNNDPFLRIKETIHEPETLDPVKHLNCTGSFNILESAIADINTGKSSIILFFSKLKYENKKFIEWPSQNISLLINEKIVNYDVRGGASLNQVIKSGKNILKLEGVLDHKCVLAIYLCHTKIDVKDVAKMIVDLHQVEDDPKQAFVKMAQNDPDIFTGNIAIKDPLLAKVISVPVRGINCKHLNCFDLLSFLKFNYTCRTESKWACCICKSIIPWKELRTDHHIYYVIREVKQKFGENKLDNIHSVVIDENGDWKLPEELSDEIGKSQVRKPVEKIKKPREVEEIKEEPLLRKVVKKNELSIEECFNNFKNIRRQYEYMQDYNKKDDNVAYKMRELACFKNFAPKKMYEFIVYANLHDFFDKPSFFTKIYLTNNNAKIEDLIDTLVKNKFETLVKYIFAWALNANDLLNISLYISTKNKSTDLDFSITLELILAFSRYMELYKIYLNFEKVNMSHVFGTLIRLLCQKLEWSFQQTFFFIGIIRRYLPDLLQPTTVEACYTQSNQKIWKNIAELISSLTKDYDEETFVIFMTQLYTPALENITDKESKVLAKYLYMLFRDTLKYNNINITNDKINELFDKWDLSGHVRSYLNSCNLTLDNIIENL